MGTLLTKTRERTVLGLPNGGRIPLVEIDSFFANACHEFYARTECVEVVLAAIDETKDQEQYTLPALVSDGQITRIAYVERNGTRIDSSLYTLRNISPNDGAATETLELYSGSPETAVGSLVVAVVASYPTDDFIPGFLMPLAEIAISDRVMAEFCLQEGKPWANGGNASVRMTRFAMECSRARYMVMHGNTDAGLRMKPTNTGFIT